MVIPIDEINTSVSIPSLIKDSFIQGGTFSVLDNSYYEMYTGGFSVVFPVLVGDEKWAFRCWHVTIDKAMERYKLLSAALPSYKLPYFIDFYYEERGIVVGGTIYPTIRMKWVQGRNIKEYIGQNLNNSEKLFRLAGRFLKMVKTLHKASIAHGDLQHENIMVNSRGNLVLIDYDSLYIPELKGVADEDIIAGKPDYQHPCREKNKTANPKIDYFSEVVILLGILGLAKDKTLWGKYHVADSNGLLFSKDDYSDIRRTRIYRDLDSLGYPFHELLQVLCAYLKCSDINQLEPFDSFGIFDEAFDIVQYFKEQGEHEKEDALWKEVIKQDTIDAYSKYLADYPNGKYVSNANKRASEIEEKRKIIAEAATVDKRAWKEADSIGTIESYTMYLQKFPSGANALKAKDKIEEIRWKVAEKADTIEAYNDYLKYCRSGRANIARARIKQIKADDGLWDKAFSNNTIDGYNDYLKKYPIGKHEVEAKRQLDQLTEQIKRHRKTRRVIVAIFCAGMMASFASVGPEIIRYVCRDSSTEIVKEKSPAEIVQQNISEMERETEKLIVALEVAKKYGAIDNDKKMEAKLKLEELRKGNSSKYNSLKQRYDRL